MLEFIKRSYSNSQFEPEIEHPSPHLTGMDIGQAAQEQDFELPELELEHSLLAQHIVALVVSKGSNAAILKNRCGGMM